MSVATYRCKHAVEAMRWTNTDDDRETFARWFESHGSVFKTYGQFVPLGADHNLAVPGEWILWSHEEFIVMDDEQFHDEYEPDPKKGG